MILHTNLQLSFVKLPLFYELRIFHHAGPVIMAEVILNDAHCGLRHLSGWNIHAGNQS